MEKPFRFIVIDNNTKKVLRQTNIEPSICENVTIYIDTRYEAKLRLFNYVTYTKHVLNIPKYEPYKNIKIGISIPIINF